MRIPWSPDLETGVEVVDSQHKELFSRVNRLLDACMTGKGLDEVNETVTFLNRYVVEHFETEEKVMRQAKYEGFEEHRKLHGIFRNAIEALARDIRVEGVGPHTVVRVNRTIVGWLNDHIRRVDRAMAAKLRADFASAATS